LLNASTSGSIAIFHGNSDIMPTVRFWVFDGILASGVAGPIDVLHAANSLASKRTAGSRATSPKFVWRVESLDGQPVRAASGQSIAVDGCIDARKRSDAILVTAPFVADMDAFLARHDQVRDLSSALRLQHKAGTLLASYCTGSYLLAEAGLLDHRIATTHWSKAADFSRRYPKVELRSREVLTEQSGILCGGAVTSYLNLAVRLVERLTDSKLAMLVAKTLLIDVNRASQASYATLLDEQGHTDQLVVRAQRQMEATLQQRFRMSDLAAHLAVSERTLHRRFKQAVGDTPVGYLQTLRVEVAKRLLESGDVDLDAISERVGYGDPSTFRQLFKHKTELSPREYQRRFARSLD
jgi:transcriptional regulator GlxA family with amidase domain